jgi:hypothetical protein
MAGLSALIYEYIGISQRLAIHVPRRLTLERESYKGGVAQAMWLSSLWQGCQPA